MPRLSAVVAACVAGVVSIVAVALVVIAIQFTRTIVSVSSDPWRDIDVRVLPSQTPSSGVAGLIARGERINLLLLGYGGDGHDGAYLTDSLMVASIEPQTATVTLFSIPRDLWVTVSKSKYSATFEAKINEAFSVAASAGDRDEGIRVAVSTIESVLGIPIDRTIALDFRAFRTVVDAIGGVDVIVDRSFTSMYPKNDDPSVDASWIEISFAAGPQHMDGETALRYARARYSDGPEGSDFARAKRQQKVLLAAKDRIVAADAFTKLFGLTEALRDNVRTDLSLSDIQALASFARAYDDEKTVKTGLSTDNVLQNGYTKPTGYALWPKVEGWREVHAFAQRAIVYPTSLAENAQIVVLVSGARATIGLQAARRLTDLGLRARVESTDTDEPTRTTISAAIGVADSTTQFLSDYFNDSLLASASAPGQIVVRLGRDWVPPIEFAAPNESPTPAPSPSPSVEPAVRPPAATLQPERTAVPTLRANAPRTPRPTSRR